MAEKAHSDMKLHQRHVRASKVRDIVQVLFWAHGHAQMHTRCTVTLGQAFVIQGQGMGLRAAFMLYLGIIFFVDYFDFLSADLPSLSLTTKLYPKSLIGCGFPPLFPALLSQYQSTRQLNLLQCLGVRKDQILLGLTYWEPLEPS